MAVDQGQPDLGQIIHAEGGVVLKRESVGRLDAILSQASPEAGGVRAIHVRLRPAARSFGRRFREGDALRLLGFTPRPECHFFPVGCFYGGCYYRVLDESAADELFDKVVAGLTGTVESLVQAAWSAEDIGLPLR